MAYVCVFQAMQYIKNLADERGGKTVIDTVDEGSGTVCISNTLSDGNM